MQWVRDSQAALVALNRFGFGARGAHQAIFINAASDPPRLRQGRTDPPSGVLLEGPGLQSTPALGKPYLTIGSRSSRPRDAAAKMPASEANPTQPAEDAKGQRKIFRSAASRRTMVGKDPAAKERRMQAPENGGANAVMVAPEAMQPNAPKPLAATPEHHPERPTAPKPWRGCNSEPWRIAEFASAGGVLVESFLHFRQQGAGWRGCGRLVRARAIRPFCAGALRDMLKRSSSIRRCCSSSTISIARPGLARGQNRKRGLNENLAREIMELHTLGVDGGYSQDDVTSLARIITGWTYAGRQDSSHARQFRLQCPMRISPGAQRLMGKVYENNGVAQGEAGAGGYRPPSLHREIHRHQIRPSLRRRRSAAGPGGAAAGRIFPNPTVTSGAGDSAAGSDEAWQRH